MKKRTRVVSYIWMARSMYTFIVLLPTMVYAPLWIIDLVLSIVSPHAQGLYPPRPIYWWTSVGILIASLEWPFWWGLLKQKVWAWKVLVLVYCTYALERIWTLATAPAYYAAHPEVERPVLAFALTLFWALIGIGIPLWVLLTDLPAKWRQAETDSRDVV